ncbi:MAG: methylated-DNA--[protein]-cysteine S-methyltransferase [Rhizomicrobium sp.]
MKISRQPPKTVFYGFARSPFGQAIALFSDDGLCGFGFGAKKADLLADYRKRWPVDFIRDDDLAQKIIGDVFAGKCWPLHLIGSDWQIAVWRALLKIRPAKTTSYGALAEILGHPKAARAVGTAVGQNPIAYLVPCHRVVAKSGAMTGYHWGVELKEKILAVEQVGGVYPSVK